MKIILRSLFIIGTVSAIAGAATYAGLINGDAVADNLLQMVTDNPVKIVIDKNGVFENETNTGNSLPVNISGMYPGFTSQPHYFAVANTGALPFNWKFNIINSANSGGPNGTDGIKDVLKFSAWQAGIPGGYDYVSGFNCQNEGLYTGSPLFQGLVKDWATAMGSGNIDELNPAKGSCFKFEFYLDQDLQGTDNDYIGAASRYTIEANAEQAI